MNKVELNYDIDEVKAIKAKATNEYSHCYGGYPNSLGGLPVEPVKNETTKIDSVRKNYEGSTQGGFIKTEIKLENTDFEADNFRIADEKPEDMSAEDRKPKVLIKSDSEVCYVSDFNFHDIQAATNTDRGRSYEVNKPPHCVKSEEITIFENCLVKEEAVESKL